MKIVVIGATGGTGKQLVEQGIAAGHEMTAVIRNPAASLTIQHKNLEIIQGDVLKTHLEPMLKGNDVVMSVLGVHSRAPTVVYSQGVTNIINAMVRVGIRRLICVSASGLDPGPLWQRLIAKPLLWALLKEGYTDMTRMEAEIRKHNDLDWTIVRPPRLTDNPVTGQYKVSINKHLSSGWQLSRADLAHYILGHIDDHKTYRAMVEVAY